MNQLEQLLFQKREIEKKIKELKSGNFTEFGCVRIEKKDDDDPCWYVSFLTKQTHRRYESYEEAKKKGHKYSERELRVEAVVDRWQKTFKEATREAAMERIKQTIDDLNGLYQLLLEEGEKIV